MSKKKLLECLSNGKIWADHQLAVELGKDVKETRRIATWVSYQVSEIIWRERSGDITYYWMTEVKPEDYHV